MNDFSPILTLQEFAESGFLHFKALANSIPGIFWSASFVVLLAVMARIFVAICWKYFGYRARPLASEDWVAADAPSRPFINSHPECIEAEDDAAKLLIGRGHEVDEVQLLINRDKAQIAYLTVVAAGTAADMENIARLQNRPAIIKPIHMPEVL